MERAYRCGHTADEPRNMGRGMAREHRLANFFASNCPECARLNAVLFAAKLTHVDGTRYNLAEQEAAAERRFAVYMRHQRSIQL